MSISICVTCKSLNPKSSSLCNHPDAPITSFVTGDKFCTVINSKGNCQHYQAKKDVTYEQAKEEIAKYFEAHNGEKIDAADLQDALGIEISTAMEICEELEQEKKIKWTRGET